MTFPDRVICPAPAFLRLTENTCVPSACFFLRILFTIFSSNIVQATLLPKKWKDFTALLRSKNTGKERKTLRLLWVIIVTWYLIIMIEGFFNFPKCFWSHNLIRASPYQGVTGPLFFSRWGHLSAWKGEIFTQVAPRSEGIQSSYCFHNTLPS